jgi:hypothetical protein
MNIKRLLLAPVRAHRHAPSSRLGPLVLIVALLFAQLAFGADAPTAAAASPLSFAPVADTYVSASALYSPVGDYQYLAVQASPVHEAYVKFQLSGLGGRPSSVKLRLYATRSGDGGVVKKMSNTSWTESVTYANKPAIDGPVLATLGAVTAGQVREVDVTSAVAGDGTLSLGLTYVPGTSAAFASSEDTGHAPQLVVTVATPTPTTRPAPVAGQPCPQWYHDAITAVGPDGQRYPTWHPAVDRATGCYFGHEHGDDPRTSLVNPAMPAFGYIGKLAGDDEPHAGFKVFVQNHGAVNNDGRTIAHDSRMVFHMGTGGVKRFDTRLHSLEYDFREVGGTGHEMHVKGMADTGGVGSICTTPRQGKTVETQPGTGCAVTSLYEIWAVALNVGGRGVVNASFAAFDPITVMNPSDHTRLLYTSGLFPQYGSVGYPAGSFHGCDREAYAGPNYFSNPNGPTTFTTDAFGKPGGTIQQFVSRHNDLGVRMTTDGTQFQAKLGSRACGPGLQLAN